ncbi:MAG: histidine ammonia-lyase [Candidatus Sericytochromatia bacterium]
MEKIILDGNSLDLDKVEKISKKEALIELSEESKQKITKSRYIVEKILKSDKIVYGINTGFGFLKNVIIPEDKIEKLQENLIISHSTGVGDYFEEEIARNMLLLRINSLAKGFSGIRLEVIQTLIDFLNKGISPLVPCKGSVGASGDLAPLSHMVLPLMGIGDVLYKNKILSAEEVLKINNLQPITLKAKEGLALINGTQAMTAVACKVLNKAKKMIDTSEFIASMTVDALKGTNQAYRNELHIIRPHQGQIISAKNMFNHLKNSEIMNSHPDCEQVQDAYSLRCIPQVHGAVRDAINYVETVLLTEINSVTDNPIILPDTEEVISGGNFHGEPVAIAMDFLSVALSELGNISERRVERLVNPSLSNGLPAFLTNDGGINSGYMIAQYTAASLVSENKSLAHPASVDSIPTSANQEDHVSMGTIAARKSYDILKNTEYVLSIEALCAAQGLDFRKPLKTGDGAKIMYEKIRNEIPTLNEDRLIHQDIEKARKILFT